MSLISQSNSTAMESKFMISFQNMAVNQNRQVNKDYYRNNGIDPLNFSAFRLL